MASERHFRYREKHSQFASSFPIYLRTQKVTNSTPDADDELEQDDEEEVDSLQQASWQRLNEKGPIWMQ
jgi:hypothetical protein